MARLIRTLRVGSVGGDVHACKRAIHRHLKTGGLAKLEQQPVSVQNTYGVFFRTLVKQAQAKLGLDETGVIGSRTADALREEAAFDAYADHLLDRYERDHAKPIVELVEPRQGFRSLHKSLWEMYSIGRNMGLADAGTYNPLSRLPSGRPSDHAVYPAYAFDLSFTPSSGFAHPAAKQFYDRAIKSPAVEYVILGDRIWTRAQGTHPYYSGGHANHVHVSGNR